MPFNGPPWRALTVGDLVYGIENAGGPGRRAFINANPGVALRTMEDYPILEDEGTWIALEGNQPAANTPAFTASIGGHNKYSQALGVEENNASARWKCKAGLYWATKGGGNVHVHFVLDGIDQNEVASKTHGSDTAPDALEKNRSITGSELRWIYRNREDPDVQAKVQFWLNNAQCAPPWTGTGQATWAQYLPQYRVNIHGVDPHAGGRNGCCIVC